ncbi:hypothetical protein Tco_1503190 [Tanacetum coccineum]
MQARAAILKQYKPAMRLDRSPWLEFDPQYLMADFSSNPDVEEKPLMPLRNHLEKIKHFLMAYEIFKAKNNGRAGRYGVSNGLDTITPSGYGVLILNLRSIVVKCRHRYVVSSLMDTAYRMSESVSSNVFV